MAKAERWQAALPFSAQRPRAFRLRGHMGIWEFARLNGEEILSAAMIVGEPNPLVGGGHDRMLVMLLPEDYEAWLGPTTSGDDLRALLRPFDESLTDAYAVSRKVNNVKNDTEECIEPIDVDQQG